MIYSEKKADGALADRVAAYWRFELEPDDPESVGHVIVPDGDVSISCLATGTELSVGFLGPSTKAHRMSVARGIYSGARLKPGVAPRLLGVAASGLRNRAGPLSQVAPDLANRLSSAARGATPDDRVEAFRSALDSALAEVPPPEPLVGKAAARLSESSCRIGDIAEELGVSRRTLERRFLLSTGLPPKDYARVRRVRRACVEAVSPAFDGWGGASCEAGFADQAHLSREFRSVFGATPTLLADYIRQIRHRINDGT